MHNRCMDRDTSISDCSTATSLGTLRTSLCTKLKHHLYPPQKFMKSGSVMNSPRSGTHQSGQSEKNIVAVKKAFDLSHEKSIWRAFLEVNITATSVQRILKCKLRLFSHKIQMAKSLNLKNTTAG